MASKLTNQSLAEIRIKSVPEWHTSGTSCYVAKALGALVADVEGREYIDFAGGIGVSDFWGRVFIY